MENASYVQGLEARKKCVWARLPGSHAYKLNIKMVWLTLLIIWKGTIYILKEHSRLFTLLGRYPLDCLGLGIFVSTTIYICRQLLILNLKYSREFWYASHTRSQSSLRALYKQSFSISILCWGWKQLSLNNICIGNDTRDSIRVSFLCFYKSSKQDDSMS